MSHILSWPHLHRQRLASLQLFETNNVLENIQNTSARISERLTVLNNHSHVGEVRQKGLMVGIDLVRDRDGMVPFDVKLRQGHQVTLAARRRGVILRPLGDVVVLMPAPAMPIDLIDRLCDVAIECIDEVTKL